MKTKAFALFAALFMSAGVVFAATNDLTALLQKGLFEEEANHNLAAAMRDYQAAIDGFDQDRQLAATAVFRLGECLRKQGQTNESNVQYGRILRDFADQTNLAALSRNYLGAKATPADGAGGATSPVLVLDDEATRKIREMIRNSPDLINAPGYEPDTSRTPLQASVQSGKIAAAELLLANGANINDTGRTGLTPLGMAAAIGNKAMIELLLAKGADVNARDKNGQARTPLDLAVFMGFKAAAEVLIAHKADVNARNPGGVTPLHVAAMRGFGAIAEMLLADGAEVNAADATGATPIFTAAQNNQPEMVQLLLSNKAEVNVTNSDGESPLFLAAKNDRAQLAQLLLTNKAQVNARDKSGYTPLHWAVINNYPDLVKLLLSNKANVNATTDIGITPLLFAVARPGVDANGQRNFSLPQTPLPGQTAPSSVPVSAWTNLVKILLDNGADPQAHIKEGGGSWGPIRPGTHALDLAVYFGQSDEMEWLLASHADPNASFAVYRVVYSSPLIEASPMFWVLKNGDNKAKDIKILLDHGADPNVADEEGDTPLSIAVRGRPDLNADLRMNLVQQLLDHHANPNLQNNQGLPPLAYADGEIRAALIKAGANEDYQRLGGIFIAQKGTGSIGQPVFRKDTATNSVDHFTLLEVVAQAWRNDASSPVAFPDFAHVVINRLKPGGGKEEVAVNLVGILTNGNTSKDMPLEWGDVVQIPQLDHLLNESSRGLASAYIEGLTKCLERRVQIIVKGQTTKLRLLPAIAGSPMARRAAQMPQTYAPPPPPLGPGIMPPAPVPPSPPARIATNEATPETSPVEKTLYTFLLSEVVQKANVLLLSSDLSRVKVTRHGVEMQYKLAEPATGRGRGGFGGGGGVVGNGGGRGGRGGFADNSSELWLRDGDVIEIPECDPNAPAAE